MKKYTFLVIIILLYVILGCEATNEDLESDKDFFDKLYKIKVSEIDEVYKIENPINILDEKPHIKVKIGIYKSTSGGMLLLADGLTYFEELGVYPKFVIYPDYESLILAFKQNNVDLATIGLYESMLLILDNIDFLGILPLSYKGVTFASSTESEILSFKDLKDAKVGLNRKSIDYFLLKKGLENTSNLSIKDIKQFEIAKAKMYDAFNEKYIDGGFFDAFSKPSSTKTNILSLSTRFKLSKVETLLVNKEFVTDNKIALELIITAYKKGLTAYKNYNKEALEVISDVNRLDVSKLEFEMALADEPIIELTDDEETEYNKNTIINTLFHSNGAYNKEAIELLNFIVNNYKEYNKKQFRDKTEKVRVQLLRSQYFTLLYLAATGFHNLEIKNVVITNSMREKWGNNIRRIKPQDTGNF